MTYTELYKKASMKKIASKQQITKVAALLKRAALKHKKIKVTNLSLQK